MYSNVQIAEIIELYIKNGKSSTATIQAWQQRHPGSDKPTDKTITKFYRNFIEGKYTTPIAKKSGRPRTATKVEQIEAVKAYIAETPNMSVRERGYALGISRSSMYRILKKKMHPYKVQTVQEPSDPELRMEYAFQIKQIKKEEE